MNEHSNPHASAEEIEIPRNRLAAAVQLAAGNSLVKRIPRIQTTECHRQLMKFSIQSTLVLAWQTFVKRNKPMKK
jgi:hypothetical protein